MRFVLCISCNGLAFKRTRLAVFPASMVPNESERPKKLAGFKVAARRASDGVKPASTSRANSSCRLVPGRSPFSSRTLLEPVPARIETRSEEHTSELQSPDQLV